MRTRHVVAASMLVLAAASVPGMALAQARSLSQPALPLSEALQRIAAEWGKPVNIDPDAVRGITSRPVKDATSERDAVAQATRGLPVAVMVDDAGVITIANDIIVTARPNEAELNVLVRGSTSSSRFGQSLRDQARNTQVISAKLLQQQQAQSMTEALANAGGVVVNTATVQGGVGYTVRGFSAQGAVNGLPSASNSTFAAGTTQSLANIERIEVLKGPDAILLGGDNLGGTINIVTKKPNAQERLYASFDTGSFGLIRGTLDANRAISSDDRLSARIIATVADADRNFGGYRGDEDYLFAPSIRYKNAVTDVIVSASIGAQLFGMVPYTLLNTATGKPFDLPGGRRLVGGPDQGVQIGTTQFNGEITQKVTDWLTVVARVQHQNVSFALRQYSPFAVLNNSGLLLLSRSGTRQTSKSDAIDSFARIAFETGSVTHKLVAGFTRTDTDVKALYADDGGMFPYNFLTTPPQELPALAIKFGNETGTIGTLQTGFYGQYLVGLGSIHLSAGLRRNEIKTSSVITGRRPSSSSTNLAATTPNYGAVVDISDNFSVFGTLAYGYRPTFTFDRLGNRLPDIESRNTETGVKWDLFNKRVLINASWFSIRQNISLERDPVSPSFQRAIPGMLGRGVDLNISGEPLRGLTVSGAFTRTKYRLLQTSASVGLVTAGEPRDVYNLYASYEHRFGGTTKAGLGAGVTGRSSSFIDTRGLYTLPAAVQANLNGFLSIGRLDLNIGVRNLFDRENFNPTRATSYVPLGEPRTWRLTVGYRFF
ncbi:MULTISPECIES: TonB-dependent siderophore receptor [unclassified Sphingomonas]|uniref:TonB-dependent siderophore receptor n=1 Tax=unclassified Sphingomonas TaxID=196159 RepID=UPI0009EBAE02|nr:MULTISPECIES: TonB-dependent receptor [unclassified Sphingomonas]